MILTRFSTASIIRSAAVLSVLLGIMYMPSVFHFSLPISGLGSELMEGQRAAEFWARYAVFGGLVIFAGSFLLNVTHSQLFRRIILTFALIATLLLILAQLPPLFWWMYLGGAVFSWSSVAGVTLHLLLFITALWGTIVTIYTIEQRA